MAGHSQFKNIMHRKGAQDAKKAKVFAKITREIMVAAKLGADPQMNARLRAALATAREANMPKDNIDRAIKKASGGEDSTNYDEVTYEGYGPYGVAVIVECLTDNRNRTAAEIRSAFSKSGGNMGETGSVSFMFEHVGVISFDSSLDFDRVFEMALEAGADDVEIIKESYVVVCSKENFSKVREQLTSSLQEPKEFNLIWKPITNSAVCEDEEAGKIFKLIETLEDNDDVQNIFTNVEFSSEFAEKLKAT